MRYYLELAPIHGEPTYRFQSDRTWRKVSRGEALRETDYTTPNAWEILELQRRDQVLTIDGQNHHVERSGGEFFETRNDLYYNTVLSRSGETPRPSFDQMMEVIGKADDRYANRLVLKVNGKFEVRNCERDEDTFRDPSVVVRHESWSGGGGYVGAKAASDPDYYKRDFTDSMSAWKHHLKSGKCNVYCDLHTDEKLEDIEKELAAL